MAFDLDYIKKHKVAVGAVVVGALVIIYLVSKNSGSNSSSGISSVLAQQNQGQLQMAQLNAQLTAQGNQTQAQLEAEQISAGAQQQQEQDQTAASIVAAQLGYNSENTIAGSEISAIEQQQSNLLGPETSLADELASGSLAGHTAEQQSIENALALLLSEGGGLGSNSSLLSAAGGLPSVYNPGGTSSTGVGITLPGIGNLGLYGI
jgi:hypothetical protein